MAAKKLNLVLSLLTDANDYQQEMAASARAAAVKLGVHLEVVYAGSDPIRQIQDLLKAVNREEQSHSDGNSPSSVPPGRTQIVSIDRRVEAAAALTSPRRCGF